MGIISFGIGFGVAYMARSREVKLATRGLMNYWKKMNSTHPFLTYKMVIVVREDLNMSKGKIASQCAHATLLNYQQAFTEIPFELKEWERDGQKKVVLRTTNEKTLMGLYNDAKKHKLCASIVCDAGRTEVKSGTMTVLAVGPGPDQVIDLVTGGLYTLK